MEDNIPHIASSKLTLLIHVLVLLITLVVWLVRLDDRVWRQQYQIQSLRRFIFHQCPTKEEDPDADQPDGVPIPLPE